LLLSFGFVIISGGGTAGNGGVHPRIKPDFEFLDLLRVFAYKVLWFTEVAGDIV
jgi:hypothetical protein